MNLGGRQQGVLKSMACRGMKFLVNLINDKKG